MSNRTLRIYRVTVAYYLRDHTKYPPEWYERSIVASNFKEAIDWCNDPTQHHPEAIHSEAESCEFVSTAEILNGT